MANVFLVEVEGTGQESAWSTKRLAAAEVRSVAKKLFPKEKNVIGSKVFFTEKVVYDGDVDSESLAYGKDFMNYKAFKDAVAPVPDTPASIAKKKKRGGWH